MCKTCYKRRRQSAKHVTKDEEHLWPDVTASTMSDEEAVEDGSTKQRQT